MNRKIRKNGLTLTELVVVIAVAAVLLGISVPAVKKVIESFDQSAGPRSLIDAALTGARALAAAHSAPAGIRFQRDRKGDFYMIFIVHKDVSSTYATEFVAVPNRKPIKLPASVGVLAGTVQSDADLNDTNLLNAQTFSIVFSEQGQLIQFPVRVLNRDGVNDDSSRDPIFNTRANVDSGTAGMFYQDAGPGGLNEEDSIGSFYIYDPKRFAEIPANQRFTGYIHSLPKEFVNPHTGQLIGR
ncbi:MAG TPA: prepilin-type N-terminal cleavage/methylation domain-containing protein [Anaerohalosphaeraceae bacterium]|nr:prepilin-type N-terminal cleavage/methylation domain-containing protein [Anaerohalosphaeraceae bacterium]